MYPKNQTENLSLELFRNPTSEYRGTPFWSWNCKLDEAQLHRQVDYLQQMGMGGFHIHCRTGMATEYLSDEFMDLVQSVNKKGKENQMLTWLYDEDRWPSGAAGGYVTREMKYRSRFLVFSPTNPEENKEVIATAYGSTGRAQRSQHRQFIAKYEILLEDGYLTHYRRLKPEEEPQKKCQGLVGTFRDLWGKPMV